MENRKHEPLYQVMATEVKTGQLVPVPLFPRVVKDSADHFVDTMRQQIVLGNEKRYTEPHAILLLTS